MKRGAPLKSDKPLKSRAPLKATKALKSATKKITGRSKAAIEFEREYNEARPKVIERAEGMCEIGLLCEHKAPAVHVHHAQVGRSHGGSNDMDKLWATCEADHTWIHSHATAPIVKFKKWLVKG